MPCRFSENVFGWVVVTSFLAAFAGPSVASGQSGTKLFNGWTITPAGTVIPLDHLESVVQDPEFHKPAGGMASDLPLKMIVSPDGKLLLAACAGYNNTGLAVIELASKKLVQFFPLPQVWNGLAFSADGKRVFLAGGSSGTIRVFTYENGKLTPGKAVKPATTLRNVFLAGIAVDAKSGKLYVANEANHEIWVLDSQDLSLVTSIPVGQHPHSCIFGGDAVHLYVSNWGGRSVSVIDTATAERVRDRAVGIRPNDMALSRRRPALRGLLGRQHGPRDPDANLGESGSGGQSPAASARGRRGRSSRLRSIPPRRKAARPTPWPWPPTARRCTWPTPTTTT